MKSSGMMDAFTNATLVDVSLRSRLDHQSKLCSRECNILDKELKLRQRQMDRQKESLREELYVMRQGRYSQSGMPRHSPMSNTDMERRASTGSIVPNVYTKVSPTVAHARILLRRWEKTKSRLGQQIPMKQTLHLSEELEEIIQGDADSCRPWTAGPSYTYSPETGKIIPHQRPQTVAEDHTQTTQMAQQQSNPKQSKIYSNKNPERMRKSGAINNACNGTSDPSVTGSKTQSKNDQTGAGSHAVHNNIAISDDLIGNTERQGENGVEHYQPCRQRRVSFSEDVAVMNYPERGRRRFSIDTSALTHATWPDLVSDKTGHTHPNAENDISTVSQSIIEDEELKLPVSESYNEEPSVENLCGRNDDSGDQPTLENEERTAAKPSYGQQEDEELPLRPTEAVSANKQLKIQRSWAGLRLLTNAMLSFKQQIKERVSNLEVNENVPDSLISEAYDNGDCTTIQNNVNFLLPDDGTAEKIRRKSDGCLCRRRSSATAKSHLGKPFLSVEDIPSIASRRNSSSATPNYIGRRHSTFEAPNSQVVGRRYSDTAAPNVNSRNRKSSLTDRNPSRGRGNQWQSNTEKRAFERRPGCRLLKLLDEHKKSTSTAEKLEMESERQMPARKISTVDIVVNINDEWDQQN